MVRYAVQTLLAAIVLVIACGECLAQQIPADKLPAFAVPRIAKAPTIDGKIEKNEWREAVAVSGVTNQETNQLIPRPTTFYVAWDADNIYMASRTWVMPNYKPRVSGRRPFTANVGDDSLELHFQPQGENVPAGRAESSYKFIINALGFEGDVCRVSVGQMFRNWQPNFRIAAKMSEPGTAPSGGRWLDIEMAASTKDFELTGPNRAGDVWRMMFGSNHFPAWIQARIACNSGYFDPSGYCQMTLVENTPAVQVTMDELPGLTSGTASVKIKAYNPTNKEVKLSTLMQFAEMVSTTVNGKPENKSADLLKDQQELTVPAGETKEFTLNKKFDGGDLTKNTGSMFIEVKQGKENLFRYFAWFKSPVPMPTPWPMTEAFPLEMSFNPVQCNLQIVGDAYYLPNPDDVTSLKYRIFKEGQDKAVFTGAITKADKYFFRELVQLPKDLAEGKYRVETFLVTKNEKEIGPVKSTFEKLNEAKTFADWWQTKLGNIERVIPPFTAMTNQNNVITTVGRAYEVNGIGLPNQIRSQDGNVLAEPARIVVVVNGKEERIPLTGDLACTENKPWRVAFEGKAKGAGLVFTSKCWIEQDGLAHMELTYAPEGKEPVTVDALRIEFPIAPEQAQSLLCIGPGGNFSTRTTKLLPADAKEGRMWGTLDMGRLGSLMTVGSFFPVVWLGNDERGFMWWGDNDKGWFPEDAVSAHEVFRDAKAVVLRNNIIGKTVKLDKPRTIEFGYNASPFKPQIKNWRRLQGSWDGTFSGGGNYGGAEVLFKKYKDPKTGTIFDGWQLLSAPAADPKDWPAIWAVYKKIADKQIEDRLWTDPSGARNGCFVHSSLPMVGYGWKSPDASVTTYFGADWGDGECFTQSNIDYYLYLANRSFKEGGLRTIYWDLFFPTQHNCVQNGVAYELPDGRTQPGYAGFNTRRFVMRMYALMDENHLTPGSQVAHATNAYLLVAAPWVDAILDGEFHKLTDESTMDWVDGWPIERMRTMSVPDNWGTAISWMNHIQLSPNNPKLPLVNRGFTEYPRMFDCWAGYGSTPTQPMIEFGLLDEGTKFLPFWRNPDMTTGDKDILVSAWKSDGRVILSVFNNSKAGKDATVKLDLAKLGLTGELAGNDLAVPPGDAATKYDLASGTVTLPGMTGHTGRIIGIRSTDKAALAKANASWAEMAKLIDPKNPARDIPANVLNNGMVTPKTQFLGVGAVPEVTCDDKDIQVAAWRLGDRVMLVVHNASATAGKDAVLKIDLDKLGVLPKLMWQEFIDVQGAKLDLTNKTITVPGIAPGGGATVLIRKY